MKAVIPYILAITSACAAAGNEKITDPQLSSSPILERCSCPVRPLVKYEPPPKELPIESIRIHPSPVSVDIYFDPASIDSRELQKIVKERDLEQRFSLNYHFHWFCIEQFSSGLCEREYGQNGRNNYLSLEARCGKKSDTAKPIVFIGGAQIHHFLTIEQELRIALFRSGNGR